MAVFRNDQEIKNFVEDFLKEKINADELSSEYQLPSKEGRCYYLTSKNGLPDLVMLGVVESHAFLRFWDEHVKEKSYRKRNLPFLESNSSKIKEILGDATYNFNIEVNGFQPDIKECDGFLITYDDRDSRDEIKTDLNRMFEVVKLMNTNDDKLQLIRNIDDLKKQLEKVEDGLRNDDESMKNLIKNGRCFVSYRYDGNIHFAPSRFVGYRNKTIKMHNKSVDGDGRETNAKLDSILGKKRPETENPELLEKLNAFAETLGITVDKHKHSFWESNIVLDSLGVGDMKRTGIRKPDKGNIELNTILYGPPGTGKTFNTLAYAVAICNDENVEEVKGKMQKDYKSVKEDYDNLKKNGRIEFVTFHQSYGYEDFIEGIRPIVDDESSGLKYEKYQGVFKKFCEKAENDEKQNYVFTIDEINRGNISKIFGELITLIEPSKRLGEKESMKVTLPCSGDEFGVPNNVYILGTMNTADRSIAMMDTALRRRFNFVEMMPDTSELSPLKGEEIEYKGVNINICEMLKTINERIEYLYDREHTIGHAFFVNVKTFDDLKLVFKNKVIPLLQEYFYDDYEKIRLVLGDNGKDEKNQFIKRAHLQEGLFKKSKDDEDLNSEKNIYRINQEALGDPDSYKGII